MSAPFSTPPPPHTHTHACTQRIYRIDSEGVNKFRKNNDCIFFYMYMALHQKTTQ
jgi:hypothetical protein